MEKGGGGLRKSRSNMLQYTIFTPRGQCHTARLFTLYSFRGSIERLLLRPCRGLFEPGDLQEELSIQDDSSAAGCFSVYMDLLASFFFLRTAKCILRYLFLGAHGTITITITVRKV